MEDTRWLRLVTIGLVLAAIAVGYFLLSQRFSGNRVSDSGTQIAQATPSPEPAQVAVQPTPAPSVSGLPSTGQETPPSAYQRIAERTKGGVEQLPATGSPTLLVGLLSLAAVVAGFGLRKFPN